MTHQMNLGQALRNARLKAGETQLSLSMRVREKFRDVPGRKTSEVTICRIERGGQPLGITWARLRSILPTLPDFG